MDISPSMLLLLLLLFSPDGDANSGVGREDETINGLWVIFMARELLLRLLLLLLLLLDVDDS